jgi:uncharacterized protein
MINEDLEKYIKKKIFPMYLGNDGGHDINHIKYVINRSLKFASMIDDINLDMVYVVAAYHDVGEGIDRKKHEMVSSNILRNDLELKKYFSVDEIDIMCEAVLDHRASNKQIPRNIYGKIVSSADRNTSVDDILYRTYEYVLKHRGYLDIEEIIEYAYKHITDKFGIDGYAKDKMYFDDIEYNLFLSEIRNLLFDKKKFYERYLVVIKERK